MGNTKAILQPDWDDYNNLIHKEGEDFHDMRIMTSAAIFFNYQHLKGKPEAEIVTVIHYETEKLLHFNYHNFTPEFICRLKNGFTKLVDEFNRDHDFDKLVISDQFQTSMQKRIKGKKLDPNVQLTWNNDDYEYACKV